MDYDLIVIGADRSGVDGALAAAQLNKRVALVEGGSVTRPTGWFRDEVATTPTFHNTSQDLVGKPDDSVGHTLYPVPRRTIMDAVCRYGAHSAHQERTELQEKLDQVGVFTRNGTARFLGPHEIEVSHEETRTVMTGDRFLIAVGTRSNRPRCIPFDGKFVLDSDELSMLEGLPRSMIVVGGGMLGVEYANLLAVMGVQTTLISETEQLLDSWDDDIVDGLMKYIRSLGVRLCFGDAVTRIERMSDNSVLVEQQSGKRLKAESVLAGLDRVGRTERLNLSAAGIEPDEKGRLWCNAECQTWVPHIYAVGDVVGFPVMANIGLEQGRRVIRHAFEQNPDDVDTIYTLSTVPELAMVGKTEEQLVTEGVPYEVDCVSRNEIASRQRFGVETALLKLLWHSVTHRLLGVHSLGDESVDWTKTAQTIMASSGTVHDFCDAAQIERTSTKCAQVAIRCDSQTFESDDLPTAGDYQDASIPAYDRAVATLA